MKPEYLTAAPLAARHGFFTRRGGVSEGAFASLNCNLSSADSPDHVARNRALVASSMGVPLVHLLGVKQVHGADVVTVERPWTAGAGAAADAMVTAIPGLALGIITADCAPVLFFDHRKAIAGAAHAGWKGAVAGVLEATVQAMCGLGAKREDIAAVVGPCIAQASYEIAADLREAVLSASPFATSCFSMGKREARWQFDLSGYCRARLERAGIAAHGLNLDTAADEARFFSHRRRTLRGEAATGHQISVVVI